MTLEQTLGANPYKSQIISVIQHLNAVDKRPKNSTVATTGNPFEALAIGYILKRRMQFWNEGNPPGGPEAAYKWCCVVQGEDYACCRYVEASKPCPNIICGEFPTSTQRTGSITVRELIENMAAESNYDTPWSDFVTSFEYQMKGITMNGANDWVHFCQIVEVFYDNVNFLPYFDVNYSSGEYTGVVRSLLGGEYRDGYMSSGLQLSVIAEGSDSSPATNGGTQVTYNFTDPAQDGSYFLITVGPSNIEQIWFNLGAGVAPTLEVVPGYVVALREVIVDPALGGVDFAAAVSAWFLGTPGYDSVTNSGTNTVTWRTNIVGTRLASTFPAIPGEWIGNFVDGTDAETGHDEMVEIDYSLSNYDDMPARWFKMNETDEHFFYYELEGSPIDPASFGIPYDFAHPIVVVPEGVGDCCNRTPACDYPGDTHECRGSGGRNSCRCRPKEDAVQRITDLVIAETGLWTKQLDVNNITQWATIADGVTVNPDPGTAHFGSGNVVTELIAPSGRVYKPGVNYYNDIDYARAYNEFVVPGEAARGVIISFLVPMAIGYQTCYDANGDFCKKVQCGAGVDCCTPTPPGCWNVVSAQSQVIDRTFFLRTRYNAMVSMLPFNIPGNQFAPNDGQADDCSDCLI
jgi:hypothetical protein